ncbi:3-isopropylmalate dehydrogenase [Pseudonocardia sp. DLS-67]
MDGVREHRVAVIPGDGIGPEVTGAALDVVAAAEELYGFRVRTEEVDLGARAYLESARLWDDETEQALRRCDAILLGALGDPAVPPGVLERGIILRMRQAFGQAVNFRPVKLYPGVASTVRTATPESCDMVIIRENTEGGYSGPGTTVHEGSTDAVAVQQSINTYAAIERVVDFSFRLAARRRGRVALCHKKNILVAAGRLWQRVFDEVSERHPDVEVDYVHVDAMCYLLPTTPERFDVVVSDNLFGDIITDLGAVLQGGMGAAASGNLNLTGRAPSMFEPIHGSAPDIAGKGWANPVGAILSAAMCLAHLGEIRAARAIEAAAAAVLAEMPETRGPGMGRSTGEVGALVAQRVAASPDARIEVGLSPMDPLADVVRGGDRGAA